MDFTAQHEQQNGMVHASYSELQLEELETIAGGVAPALLWAVRLGRILWMTSLLRGSTDSRARENWRERERREEERREEWRRREEREERRER